MVFTDQEDQWWWEIREDRPFMVGETKRWIDDAIFLSLGMGTRCNIYVSRNVNIMIWRVLLERIPT